MKSKKMGLRDLSEGSNGDVDIEGIDSRLWGVFHHSEIYHITVQGLMGFLPWAMWPPPPPHSLRHSPDSPCPPLVLPP